MPPLAPSLRLLLRRARSSGDWICQSCLRRYSSSPARASSASSSTTTKPYYVTTPIFYVNAAPHVGHLYSMLVADVLKRFAVLRGRRAFLLTGTDEHGMKVQKAAEKAGVSPQELCDANAEIFRSLADAANVSYDYFARTSEHEHKAAVQSAWALLNASGFIYSSKHEGWYSMSDEVYFPDSKVELALDPMTGKKRPVSKETGNVVEWTSEVNYKFRLSEFQEPLLEWYSKNPDCIAPHSRRDWIVDSVKSGLHDISVSRPVDRVRWGIPVPDDATQSIYVWLDALMNYAAQTGYPHYDRMELGGWPADAHVVGKDIIRFHSIYWPAFLMALNLPLPKRIVSHAHWTVGEEKMSKSIGNVVDPFQVISVFGVDVVRWYLAMNGQLENDADWNNARLVAMQRVLRGQFGNLASRVLRGKGWHVRHSITEAFRPDMPFMGQFIEKADARTLQSLANLRDEVLQGIDQCDIRKGVNAIMETISLANASFQEAKPWDMKNVADPTDVPRKLSSAVALAAETLRICGILLQPYMPQKSQLLLDQLGVDEGKRTAEYAVIAADMDYGTPKAALGQGYNAILFPPVLAA